MTEPQNHRSVRPTVLTRVAICVLYALAMGLLAFALLQWTGIGVWVLCITVPLGLAGGAAGGVWIALGELATDIERDRRGATL